jgi:hypothetical protein
MTPLFAPWRAEEERSTTMKRQTPDTQTPGIELNEETLASVSGGFDGDFYCGNDFRFKGRIPGPRPYGNLNIGGLATLNVIGG